MTKTVLLASAAALALSGGFASAGPAHLVSGKRPIHRIINANASGTLYDQTSGETGNAFTSQNFESNPSLNGAAADDFVVPKKRVWKISEVDVPGVNFGSHPADSEDVTFYNDASGIPGSIAAKCLGVVGNTSDNGSSFAIPCKAKLKGKKTYWVSVVANQNFSTDSQWFWDVVNVIHGNDAEWENPGNGFGLGCTTWCDFGPIALGYAVDMAFTLKGKSKKS